ncbi:MAG: hypothetical protein IJT58_01640 [Synergistaceae bacterium]|nr:hypothetical protein [Synergistaceae bacterium]
MNYIAACLALAGIIMNLLQGFITIPFIGKAGLFNILNFAVDNNKLFNDLFSGPDRTKIIAGLIFLAFIPVIALFGAVRAAFKRKGSVLLAVSAVMCVAFSVFLRLVITKSDSSLGDNASLLANLFVEYLVPLIWAGLYALAAFFASGKRVSLPSRKVTKTAKTQTAPANTAAQSESQQINLSPDRYTSPCGKDYEAMTLRALIKEGLACLGEGKFNDADKYFEHALIRNPESSNAFIGRLMVKYQAKNANELVAAPVLLETEDFFQRALMFSSPRMREVLDKYRRVNRLRRGS